MRVIDGDFMKELDLKAFLHVDREYGGQFEKRTFGILKCAKDQPWEALTQIYDKHSNCKQDENGITAILYLGRYYDYFHDHLSESKAKYPLATYDLYLIEDYHEINWEIANGIRRGDELICDYRITYKPDSIRIFANVKDRYILKGIDVMKDTTFRDDTDCDCVLCKT